MSYLAVLSLACGGQTEPAIHNAVSARGEQGAAAAVTLVFECEGDYTFVVRIQRDTAWTFLPGQTIALRRTPEETATRYELDDTILWIDAESARLQSGDSTYLECANNRRRAVWEHAKLNGADFRAAGNEPGWHLEIYPDTMVLVTDYGAVTYVFATPEPTTEPSMGRTTYHSMNDSHLLSVAIEPGRCRDTMSDEEFAAVVTVTIDDRTLRGCGRPLH